MATICVKQYLLFKNVFEHILSDGYAEHASDLTCDIPNYKTYLSLEQTIRDNPKRYHTKSIFVEGYVAYGLHSGTIGGLDNSEVTLSPLPCKTTVEMEICHVWMDDLHMMRPVFLCSDDPIPGERGLPLRVHGIPYFYNAWDGGTAAGVKIFVQHYSVI